MGTSLQHVGVQGDLRIQATASGLEVSGEEMQAGASVLASVGEAAVGSEGATDAGREAPPQAGLSMGARSEAAQCPAACPGEQAPLVARELFPHRTPWAKGLSHTPDQVSQPRPQGLESTMLTRGCEGSLATSRSHSGSSSARIWWHPGLGKVLRQHVPGVQEQGGAATPSAHHGRWPVRCPTALSRSCWLLRPLPATPPPGTEEEREAHGGQPTEQPP